MRICFPLLAVALAALPLMASAAIDETFDEVAPPALPDGWTASIATGAASDLPWASVAVGYANSSPNAVFLDDVDDYADIRLTSPTYTLLPGGPPATMTFHHSYVLWAPDDGPLAAGAYSGAVLEISVNGGPFEDITAAGGFLEAGGYNTSLDAAFASPLQTDAANGDVAVWGGDSDGFITTDVTLPIGAMTVAFRWRLATEGGGRSRDTHSGWYIDDVSCDQCVPGPVDSIFADGFDGGN